MAENVTKELIYEGLKQLQSDMASVESTLAGHTRQLIRVREDINGLRMDDLRRETMQVQMDIRLQRIEKRLDLTNA